MVHHELPTSDRGRHAEVKSLLEDLSICAEMWNYLCSHKWATNPKKFADFTEQKLFPAEAEKYAKHIINKEMPCHLKKYLEVDLFPWIQMKAFQSVQLTNGWNVKASITQNTKKHCMSMMGMNALMWFIIASTHSCHLWLSIGVSWRSFKGLKSWIMKHLSLSSKASLME